MDELFGKQMTWPRLCLKAGTVALLTYNFYDYATTHSTTRQPDPWECFATDYRQPNSDGIGENMSAAFDKLIWCGFYVCLAALIISTVEIINKFV